MITNDVLVLDGESTPKTAKKDPISYNSTTGILSKDISEVVKWWNETTIAFPQDKVLYQLFEKQVVKTPNAIALKFSDQVISYSELNSRINQLAHYLCSHYDTRRNIIGVLLESSFALIAVQKVQGIYLPINHTDPAGRIDAILKDSGAEIILTCTSLLDKLDLATKKIIVFLDKKWPIIQAFSAKNLEFEAE